MSVSSMLLCAWRNERWIKDVTTKYWALNDARPLARSPRPTDASRSGFTQIKIRGTKMLLTNLKRLPVPSRSSRMTPLRGSLRPVRPRRFAEWRVAAVANMSSMTSPISSRLSVTFSVAECLGAGRPWSQSPEGPRRVLRGIAYPCLRPLGARARPFISDGMKKCVTCNGSGAKSRHFAADL